MMRIFRIAPAALAAFTIAGCSGIGEGSRPASMKIMQLSPTDQLTLELLEAPTEPGKAYMCVRTALSLFVTFTGGDIGNFTNRARWSSSNEAVVRVSNRDEPVPHSEGLVFDFGSLTPVAPGTATITAEYIGMTASIPVTVEGIDSSTIAVTPDKAVMAPGSSQTFSVRAVIDGRSTDISNVVTLAFADPDDEVATIDANGYVLAHAVGAPQTLEARLNAPCDVTPTVPVHVAALQSLEIDYEDGFANGDLVSGTTQFLRSTGHFGDVDGDGEDDTQDLSAQTIFTSSDADVLGTGGVFTGLNLVIAATAGEVPSRVGDATISATFGRVAGSDTVEEDPGVASNELAFTVYNVGFDSLRIDPAEPQTLGPLENTTYRALANYTFDGVARELNITRHVAWRSSDTALALVGSGVTASAGFAVAPSEDKAGTVVISATQVRGVEDLTEAGEANPARPTDDPDDLRDTVDLIIALPDDGEGDGETAP